MPRASKTSHCCLLVRALQADSSTHAELQQRCPSASPPGPRTAYRLNDNIYILGNVFEIAAKGCGWWNTPGLGRPTSRRRRPFGPSRTVLRLLLPREFPTLRTHILWSVCPGHRFIPEYCSFMHRFWFNQHLENGQRICAQFTAATSSGRYTPCLYLQLSVSL